MELSNRQINKDIEAHQGRLSKVQQRLDALPSKGRIPSGGRKLKQTRQQLEAEMGHVKRLVGYVEATLES